MKILSITHSPNYSLNSNYRQNYVKHSLTGDTFERTTSFKGNPVQNVKPSFEKVMKMVVAAAGALVADFVLNMEKDPKGKEVLESPEKSKNAATFLSNFMISTIENTDYGDSNAVQIAAEKISSGLIQENQNQDSTEQPFEEDNDFHVIGSKNDVPVQDTESADNKPVEKADKPAEAENDKTVEQPKDKYYTLVKDKLSTEYASLNYASRVFSSIEDESTHEKFLHNYLAYMYFTGTDDIIKNSLFDPKDLSFMHDNGELTRYLIAEKIEIPEQNIEDFEKFKSEQNLDEVRENLIEKLLDVAIVTEKHLCEKIKKHSDKKSIIPEKIAAVNRENNFEMPDELKLVLPEKAVQKTVPEKESVKQEELIPEQKATSEEKPVQKEDLKSAQQEEPVVKEEIVITPKDGGIILPRRQGTLSPTENKLRDTAAAITGLSEEATKQLHEIWQLIMTKNLTEDERKVATSKTLSGLKAHYNGIAAELNQALIEKLNDNKQLETIIENYHRKYIRKDFSIQTEAPKSTNDDYEEAKKQLVGKLDTYIVTETLPSECFATNLTNFWKIFKSNMKEKYAGQKINWSFVNPITEGLTEGDVLNELSLGLDEYKHIPLSAAAEIADAINKEPGFKYFTLHAALRLFDRFVKFRGKDVSIGDQIKNIYTVLNNAVNKALNDGINYTEHFSINRTTGKKFMLANVILDLSEADNATKKTLGNTNLIIGMGDMRTEERNKHTAIITTFIRKGM